MKKTILLLIIGTFLFACNNQEPKQDENPIRTSEYGDTIVYKWFSDTIGHWTLETTSDYTQIYTEGLLDLLGFANYCLELHILEPSLLDIQRYQQQGGWKYYEKHIQDGR